MSLVQSQDPTAALDRTVRKLIVHCGLLDDGHTQVEHAARAALAARLLDAVGGDEELINFSDPGFAAELLKLSLNKSLT
jgi:hypothetical protein